MSRSPRDDREPEHGTPTPLRWKLLAPLAALALVPGVAFLAAANIGTGGEVAIGIAVGWWVAASAIIGRTVLRRWPDLRRGVRGTLALAAVASVAAVIILTRDETVDEQIATGVSPAEAAPDARAGAPAPGGADASKREDPEPKRDVQALAGGFTGESGHAGTGDAAVVELAEGGRVLTFSDFDVDMGAGEVRVYLARGEPGSDGDVRDFKDLAPLKGNVGDQQYELPPDLDLGRYSTVVIWCVPFSTRIAQAPLS